MQFIYITGADPGFPEGGFFYIIGVNTSSVMLNVLLKKCIQHFSGQGETAETAEMAEMAEMAETVEILSESICHILFDPAHMPTCIYYGHTYQSSL